MSLRPDTDDGPVKVYMDGGNVLRSVVSRRETPTAGVFPRKTTEYDRLRHNQSGMVTLFDVDRTEHENAGDTIRKGDRARTVPVRRIDHIEWLEFGPDQ